MIKDVLTKKMQIENYIPLNLKNAVECKLPILEDEIQSVIKLDAKTSLNQVLAGENEVRYDGKVVFTALLGGENLKKCEMGVEFSYKNECKGVVDGCKIIGAINCDNVKIQTVNGIPVASCVLIFAGKAIINEENEYICDAQGLQVKKLQTENACILETTVKDFDLEDEFDLDYVVTEVLWHEQNVKVNEVYTGIGSITIGGEIELNYLTLNAEYKPVLDKKIIPFNFELDSKTAMPELIAEGFVCVKDANLKVFVDEGKKRSVVSVIIKLIANAKVIENQPITYIEDAFSSEYYLTLDKKTVKTTKSLGEKTVEKAINYKQTSEFEKNTLLLCPLFAKIKEMELTASANDYRASGIVEVGMLLSVDGNYLVETTLIPYEFEFEKFGDEINISDKTVCSVEISEAGSQLIFDFAIRLRVSELVYSTFKAVTLIEEGDKRVKSNSAISVFIPRNGDSLWDVCKSIGVLEEDVLKVNPNLTFPTSGEERIIIYRELK